MNTYTDKEIRRMAEGCKQCGDERVGEMLEAWLSERQTRKVPDGWKLVPIKPTDEMLDKGKTAHYLAEEECRILVNASDNSPESADSGSMRWRKNRAAFVYNHMLNAAPDR